MSNPRSKTKERNWSPIRLPGDDDRSTKDVRDRLFPSRTILALAWDLQQCDRKHSIIQLKRDEPHFQHQTRPCDAAISTESKTRKRKWSEEGDFKDKEHSSHTRRKHSSGSSWKRRYRHIVDSDDDDQDIRSSKRQRRHHSQSRDRSESQDLNESLELIIIGKSRNAGQFCVLGYDGNHIYRPVNFSSGSLFWQSDRFEVGKMYRFYLNRDDRSFKRLSFHPHRYNDINVTDHTESMHDKDKAKSLIKKLINNAKTRIDFHDIMERKFVVEDTECPSACLYRCSSRDVELYRSRIGKQRVSVSGFDFPFAGIYNDIRKTFDNYDRNAVVVLSLTRPFGGFSDRVFNPKRCYILVVGIHSY